MHRRVEIYVVFLELSLYVNRLQLNQAQCTALLFVHFEVRLGVGVNRHCFMHPREIALEFLYELNLVVEPSHVADCLLEVNVVSRFVINHD